MTDSVGLLFQHFPCPDYMLRIYLQSSRQDEILPEWKGHSASDFHVVICVTDEETNDFYRTVKDKADTYSSLLKKRLKGTESWDIEIKPLFRFDSIRNAERFISLIEQIKNTEEQYEFIRDLRLEYDNGWKPVREITSADFENPDGFLSFEYVENVGERE